MLNVIRLQTQRMRSWNFILKQNGMHLRKMEIAGRFFTLYNGE